MNSYQRLKQEVSELKSKINVLDILLQKEHLLNEWDKRKDKILNVETNLPKIAFIVMDAKSNWVQMEYHIKNKTVSVGGVILTPTVTQVTDK